MSVWKDYTSELNADITRKVIPSAMRGKFLQRCTRPEEITKNAVAYGALLGVNPNDYTAENIKFRIRKNTEDAKKALASDTAKLYAEFAKGGIDPSELVSRKQLIDFCYQPTIDTGFTFGERYIYNKIHTGIKRIPEFFSTDLEAWNVWGAHKREEFASNLASAFFNGLLIPDFTQVCRMKQIRDGLGFPLYITSHFRHVSHLSGPMLLRLFRRMEYFYQTDSLTLAEDTVNEVLDPDTARRFNDTPTKDEITQHSIKYHGSMRVRNHAYYFFNKNLLTQSEQDRYLEVIAGMYSCQKALANPEHKNITFEEYQSLAALNPQTEYETVCRKVKRFPHFEKMEAPEREEFFRVMVLQDAFSREFGLINRKCAFELLA